MKKTKTSNRFSTYRWTIALCLSAFLALSFLSQQVGISWDEPTHAALLSDNRQMLQTGEQLRLDLRYYGLGFDALSSGLASLAPTIDTTDTLDHIYFKHLLTVLSGVAAMAAAAILFGKLTRPRYGWLAALLLLATPRFTAHSLFNPKDIPFAAGYTALTLFSAAVLTQLLQRFGKPLQRRHLLQLLGLGTAVGVLSTLRIGGTLFVGLIPGLYFLFAVQKLKTEALSAYWQLIKRTITIGLLIILPWFLVVWVAHPSAWGAPLAWILESLAYHSQHNWNGPVLFQGTYQLAQSLPRSYLPQMIGLTTPIIVLLLGSLGLVGGSIRYRSMPENQQVAWVLIVLQLTLLPSIAVLSSATVYDGVRQFLFLFPALAVVAGAGFIWLWQSTTQGARILLALLLIIGITAPMQRFQALHPYSYLYFNTIAARVHNLPTSFENDYWGLSFRAAADWLSINSDQSTQNLVIAGPVESATLFLTEADWNVYSIEDDEITDELRPFYFLAINRYGYPDILEECEEQTRIEKEGWTLAVIQWCE